MPISRASVSWCTACVIRLTGLEKLISHARGARRATRRPYSTMAGMVRTAMAKPAGPTVSWPMHAKGNAGGLVFGALRGAAHADARDHEVGALDGRFGRGRARHADAGGHLLRQAGDDAPGAPGRCRRGRSREMRRSDRARPPVKQRHADAGAADDGDLHDSPCVSCRRGARLVARRQALRGRLAAHPGDQEAGVERIAGAGGVHHLHARRGRSGCRGRARSTWRRCSPCLMMVMAWRCRQCGMAASSVASPV